MASGILRSFDFGAKRLAKEAARRYGSALFIPGNKATDNFAYLAPHLDFDQRFADVDKLQRQLELRGYNVDANKLAQSWEYYKNVEADKQRLELKRIDIANRMKALQKKINLSPDEEREKIGLITQGRALKRDTRVIKETLWEMEETVVAQALKLPNEIDEKTPLKSSIVSTTVGSIGEPPADERRSHVDIGTELGLLEYKNPIHCYIKGDAALFEIGAMSYAGSVLADAGMTRVAGTDFGRSVVVEGSGLDHEHPGETFILSNNEGIDRKTCNRLHLTGGASLVSFLAMHTKQLINPNDFPLKYFACGRQYTPFHSDTNPTGLLTVCQVSAAQVFVMIKDPRSAEYTEQFNLLSKIASSLYDNLDVHYRIVTRSADELRAWESLRISYEMWSSYLRRYIEVGHISICGQYLSKRLLVACQTSTGRDFPATISGTILSVPRLLACLLEQNPKQFKIPSIIAEHVPKIQ